MFNFIRATPISKHKLLKYKFRAYVIHYIRKIKKQYSFLDEYIKIEELVLHKANFAMTRIGDGEYEILAGISTTKTRLLKGLFSYIKHEEPDETRRKELQKSISCTAENYYIGLPKSCCKNAKMEKACLELAKTKTEYIMNSAVFNHLNWPMFLSRFPSAIKDRETYIICNEEADASNLPFTIKRKFAVGTDAWKLDNHTFDTIKLHIEENQISNAVFLFCAGPFSNILIYQLFSVLPNNVYIDIGSALDPWLFQNSQGQHFGMTRGYIKKEHKLIHVCSESIDTVP